MSAIPRALSHRLLLLAAVLPAAALISAGPASAAVADGGGAGHGEGKPTIVLVHGAWADGSGWKTVIESLQSDGYRVVATANPLRSLSGDSAYLAALLKTIKGPIVLVGHSYGGAVITNAATGNPHVKSLVYIAAFEPDTGETATQLSTKFPGSHLSDDPNAPIPTALRAVPIPGVSSTTPGTDLYLKTDKFRDVFLSDQVDKTTSAALAAAQRPITPVAFAQPSGTPAWKTIPSWALIPLQDQAIGTANGRFMAKRAGSRTVEVNGPHAVYLTDPEAVTDLILRAAGPRSGDHDGPSLAETGFSRRDAFVTGTGALALTGGAALIVFSRKPRSTKRT
ncbi:alpha/beta fold hydrolase [Streptomyces sp. NPDC088725]|uniref:alpha/beta fold hydrolase n=1 Tax=Streptomyces sp. NPDC088725 TaxID=3365873 RepID=UPI00381E2E1F